MTAGEVDFAISGFKGIIVSTRKGTRVHLEATSLLAVCYLRKGDIESSKPLIREVLTDEKSITSSTGRKEFRRRIVGRFEEEAALASLRNCGVEKMDPQTVQDEAGQLIARMNEDEIFQYFGDAIPEHTIHLLFDLDSFSQKLLPQEDRKLLPSPEQKVERREVGKTIFLSIQRVLWDSLCSPDSDIYKAWFSNGLGFVLDKKFISTAVISALSGFGIGIKALAVSATALIIKFGIEVYCHRFQPSDIMSARETRGSYQRR